MSIEEARRIVEYSKEVNSDTLYLAGLQLTDNDLIEVFRGNEIFISNLQFLYLHNNQLGHIPFSRLKKIQWLSLWNNKLSLIPDEISKLQELRRLFIDESQLRYSFETILNQRKDLEISLRQGSEYITIPFNVLSVFEQPRQVKIKQESVALETKKKALNNLFNFWSNEAKRINRKIDELEKGIESSDETDKYLNKLAEILRTGLEILLLFLVLIVMWSWLLFPTVTYWEIIEPYKEISSATLLIAIAIFSIALKKPFWRWFHEGVKIRFKIIICSLAGFKPNETQTLKSECEKLHSKLKNINIVLKNYSVR